MPTIVQQAVALPAPPGTLYSMYLDATQHAAFTGGGPVAISAQAGSDWSAFDGRIHGRVLALTPDRQIVQSWRSFEWRDDDLDSILILTFRPEVGATRVDLTQASIPDRLYSNLMEGWPQRYWDPWRMFLTGRRAGEALSS